MLLDSILLVQSILTYRFVANSMVRLEAKTKSQTAKLQVADPEARGRPGTGIWRHRARQMDELIIEAPQQIAWMRVLDMTGKELARSGNTAGAPVYAADTLDEMVVIVSACWMFARRWADPRW